MCISTEGEMTTLRTLIRSLASLSLVFLLFKETDSEEGDLTGNNDNEKLRCSGVNLVKISHSCIILITFTLKLLLSEMANLYCQSQH